MKKNNVYNELITKVNVGAEDYLDFEELDLIGSKIVNVGMLKSDRIEGALTIDYIKNQKTYRVIFGFNELGIWKMFKDEFNYKKQKEYFEKEKVYDEIIKKWSNVFEFAIKDIEDVWTYISENFQFYGDLILSFDKERECFFEKSKFMNGKFVVNGDKYLLSFENGIVLKTSVSEIMTILDVCKYTSRFKIRELFKMISNNTNSKEIFEWIYNSIVVKNFI